MSSAEKLSFEKAIEELEKVVEELETGDLSLEESLKSYESGVELSRFCSNKLEKADKKIEIIQETNGEIEIESYNYDKGE